MADPRNFGPIWAFFLLSYRVNITSCNLCARAKVKGHIELKHFRGEIGGAISNLVAVLVSDLWAIAGKNGKCFYNNWPPS